MVLPTLTSAGYSGHFNPPVADAQGNTHTTDMRINKNFD